LEEEEELESTEEELYIPDKNQMYRSILEELKVASFL